MEIENRNIFSLEQVCNSIQKTLKNRYQSSFWVKAEWNKLNFYSHSGHCYPEIVEKKDGRIVAQMKGILWKNDFLRIQKQFLEILKEPLKDGIILLFEAKIIFDSVYGISLQILDVDIRFSIGNLEKEKQDCLSELEKAGLLDKNKGLKMPLLPKRLAIISVETSKGYVDFMNILNEKKDKYSFFCMLFPALLQGDQAVMSILGRLAQIRRVISHFDAVILVRGGGGDIGLSCYNNFLLAKEIATFPIPVLTGIGHATNQTVCELVAHTNCITPTKLAEFLIKKFDDFSFPLNDFMYKMEGNIKNLLEKERSFLYSETRWIKEKSFAIILKEKQMINQEIILKKESIRSLITLENKELKHQFDFLNRNIQQFILAKNNLLLENEDLFKKLIAKELTTENAKLSEILISLEDKIEQNIKKEKQKIDIFEIKKKAFDPKNLMEKGYAFLTKNDAIVKSISEISEDETLSIHLVDGKLEVKVIGKN